MSSYVKLNYKIIFHLLGLLLTVNGGFMALSSLVSFIYEDGVTLRLLLAGVVTVVIGSMIMIATKNNVDRLSTRASCNEWQQRRPRASTTTSGTNSRGMNKTAA